MRRRRKRGSAEREAQLAALVAVVVAAAAGEQPEPRSGHRLGMSPPSSRPVVAIDLDGVLNRLGEQPDLADGWERHSVVARSVDLPESPFVRGSGDHDLNLSLILNPDLHGPWITALRQRADVVWATMWESAANAVVAPLLGIEPLPVGISVSIQAPRFGDAINGDIAGWKAYALAESFHRRPLVWIDDMNEPFGRGWWSRQGQPTRVLTCDPEVGLTAEQMASVDAWVDGGAG